VPQFSDGPDVLAAGRSQRVTHIIVTDSEALTGDDFTDDAITEDDAEDTTVVRHRVSIRAGRNAMYSERDQHITINPES
jgi:hypothetical protein